MAAEYVDTPTTERHDATSMSFQPVDFSFAQPFASPSKNPQENLVRQMRNLRNGGHTGMTTKTPRVRNPLLSKGDGNMMQRQEFTPLLKSAKRNQILRQSIMENKENHHARGVPDTPAAFRSSFASPGTQLPVSSSMLDAEHTGSSANGLGGATPVPPVQSSSMLESTPIPQLSKRGEGGMLDQGNVLTLRDQEAKLDQIQKDNFGLKLKIHYLEEALHKTGTSFQQATLKENVELKTAKMTIEQDLKRQRKRLQHAEHELEEYRIKFQENHESLTKRTNLAQTEEIEKLRMATEKTQRLLIEREQELDQLRQQLDDATKQNDQEEVQRLKDDIQDLEAELRDHERQLDEKDDQLESLQEQLEQAKAEARAGDPEDIQRFKEDLHSMEQQLRDQEHELDRRQEKVEELEVQVRNFKARAEDQHGLQQDIDELEAELKIKDNEIDMKNRRVVELEEQLRNAHDREKSTKKLRGEAMELESLLRQTQQDLDESQEQRRALEIKLQSIESANASGLRQRDNDLQNARRELADKDGEINALKERLQTARGSWDHEAHQTDARLQEKDRVIQEKEQRLREKSQIIDDRDEELLDLQKRLRAVESSHEETTHKHTEQVRRQNHQIRELEEKLRATSQTSTTNLNEKDALIQAREQEIRTLNERVASIQNSQSVDVNSKNDTICNMQTTIRQQETTIKDQSQQIISLKARLGAMETPSKKDALLKEQAEEVRNLQRQLQKLNLDKNAELDELEQQLQTVEIKNAELESKNEMLGRRIKTADRDHSLLGHQDDKLKGQQHQMDVMDEELADLQAKLRKAIEQRQVDVKDLERELTDARRAHLVYTQEVEQRVASVKAEHAEARQALEDEILVLETSLDEAQRQNVQLQTRVCELETDAKMALGAKETGTPARERNRYYQELKNTEVKLARAQERMAILESELQVARQAEIGATERKKMHDLVDQIRSDKERVEAELSDRDQKLSSLTRKEVELRSQLKTARSEFADLQANVEQLEARAQYSTNKERELRSQLQALKDAKIQLEDLETQVGERKSSSSGHARREAELRTQLSTARAELESAQNELLEQDSRLRASSKRERNLQKQLEQFHLAAEDERLLNEKSWNGKLAASTKRHQAELKGFARQIHFLQAKCAREAAFRGDLAFTKDYFLMQVRMYQRCNEADLHLLEDIGVVPDAAIRQNRPTLRIVGLAVLACVRAKARSKAWAGHRNAHESLVKKLESMRRK